MEKSLISIVLPFKNTARYLSQCLESIMAQTYINWELLIVDDNSTDDSYQVVSMFAEKDKRIKLLRNEGNGIIDALRTAYKNAQGNFITRMDSDDVMHNEKLNMMHTDLKNNGKGHIALGLVKYFSENGVGQGYKAYQDWLNKLTRTGKNFSEIYKECVIPSPCWMVYRSDFEKCDGFRSNIYPEDYDLAFRFYKHNMRCIPSEQVLHYWRDHQNRASRTSKHYAENSFIELKINYFLKLDYNKKKPLVVWGAGKKGKKIARLLSKSGVEFEWLCDNHKKIGKHIYDIRLRHFNDLNSFKEPNVIVAVANLKEQKDIRDILNQNEINLNEDCYFFC